MRTKPGAAVEGVAVKLSVAEFGNATSFRTCKQRTTVFQDGERVDVCPLNTTRDAA